MQIGVVRRTELDWRHLGGRADTALVPVATFHLVQGDRVRVRAPDPALGYVGGGEGGTACWRGGRAASLPMFLSCPTKLTEWLQRFAQSPPPGSEEEGDSTLHAFTCASVLVVCKHGAVLGRSRHSGLWEDFGGARDEPKNERSFDTAVRELEQL